MSLEIRIDARDVAHDDAHIARRILLGADRRRRERIDDDERDRKIEDRGERATFRDKGDDIAIDLEKIESALQQDERRLLRVLDAMMLSPSAQALFDASRALAGLIDDEARLHRASEERLCEGNAEGRMNGEKRLSALRRAADYRLVAYTHPAIDQPFVLGPRRIELIERHCPEARDEQGKVRSDRREEFIRALDRRQVCKLRCDSVAHAASSTKAPRRFSTSFQSSPGGAR